MRLAGRTIAYRNSADPALRPQVSVVGLESDKVAELCKAASEATGKPIQVCEGRPRLLLTLPNHPSRPCRTSPHEPTLPS